MLSDRIVDLRLLSALDVLLEQRSVSRAALRLAVSQPAMSRMLARLRDQFGDPLLVRSRGGMVLTPRAEALRAPVRRWLREGEALLREPSFVPSQLRRRFRLASTDYGVLTVITPSLEALSVEAPHVTIAVAPLSTQSLAHLAEGQLDVVVTGYAPTGANLHVRHLFTERSVGLARTDHPAQLDALDADSFFEWPHVTTIVSETYGDPLEEADVMAPRRLMMSAANFSLVPHLLVETDALAVMPQRAAELFQRSHNLRTFEVPVELPTFDYFVVIHERSLQDAATKWLVEHLCSAFARQAEQAEAR